MRRKSEGGKNSKYASSIFSKEKRNGTVMNISSFMLFSMMTLMFSTVLGFFSYTFPFLMDYNTGILDSWQTYNHQISNYPHMAPGSEPLFVRDEAYMILNFETVERQRQQAMKKYSYPFNVNGVDKRNGLTLQEFRDVYDGKWPVILTDVVPKWPAFNWSKEYFIKNYGQEKVLIKTVTDKTTESSAVLLKQYLSCLGDGSEKAWTYLEDELFLPQRPELKSQVLDSVYTQENFFQLFPKEVQPWDCMLLWGTAHSRSSLHIDPYNWTATNAVIIGKKIWKLFPPGQDEHLATTPTGLCGFPLECAKYQSDLDAHAPQTEADQEVMSKVKVLTLEQGPGELLIIPTGWFHQAYNPVPTLAIAGQLMNSNNFRSVLEEIIKGGSLSHADLPTHHDTMDPQLLVSQVMAKLSSDVLRQGAQVTQEALDRINLNDMSSP